MAVVGMRRNFLVWPSHMDVQFDDKLFVQGGDVGQPHLLLWSVDIGVPYHSSCEAKKNYYRGEKDNIGKKTSVKGFSTKIRNKHIEATTTVI
jgi:hypothetical protein